MCSRLQDEFYDGSELCVHWGKVWWQEAKESQVSQHFIINLKTSENNGTELAIEHPAKESRRVYEGERSRILKRMTKWGILYNFFFIFEVLLLSLLLLRSLIGPSPLWEMIDEGRWHIYEIKIEREYLKSSEKDRPITPVFTTNTTWIALWSNPNWISSRYDETENK